LRGDENISVAAAGVKFNAALKRIEEKAKEFKEKGKQLNEACYETQSNSYKEAATAATQLHSALLIATHTYLKDKNQHTFKQAVENATQVALDSELKNHRGHLKQILGYAGLAVLAVLTVATAGIAYAIAGGINYAVNRQFFFSTKFNTDSVNRVLDLKEAADELAASAELNRAFS
jgi:hypothetical protein